MVTRPRRSTPCAQYRLLWPPGSPSDAPPTAEVIAAALPAGIDEAAVSDLASIAAAVGDSVPLVFDPFLVRGMGYYTGPIFEIAHPDLGYSLGGGGRYDGMIGRFAGSDVPACGFSLGFERLVDLITESESDTENAVALVYDRDVAFDDLLAIKTALVAEGARVRLLARPKNMRAALERLERDGFTRFATVAVGVREPGALQSENSRRVGSGPGADHLSRPILTTTE